MIRRLLAVLALALVTVGAGATAAHAEIVAPEPSSPRSMVQTQRYDSPGVGKCSTHGVGWAKSHRAEPGDAALLDAGNSGPNLAANILFAGARFVTEGAAASGDEVLGEDSWVRLLDTMDEPMTQIGLRAWALFGAIALSVTVIYMASRVGKGRVGEDARMYFRTAVIAGTAIVALLWPVTLGPTVDRGISGVYAAVASLGAEEQSGAAAAAAVCDAITDGVLWPAYLGAHFGTDEAAKEQFGERLWQASALSWDEQLRVDNDPAQASALWDAKRDDYLVVASEIRAERPQAWSVLQGADPLQRVGYAALALVGSAVPAVVLIWCMWMALVLMVVARLLVFAWPVIALAVQFPKLQFMAARIASLVSGWVTLAAASMVLYVATVQVVVPAFVLSDLPLLLKVLALVSLAGVCMYLWRIRRTIYTRFRVKEQVAATNRLRESAAAGVGGAVGAAGAGYRAGASRVAGGLSYRNGRPVDAEMSVQERAGVVVSGAQAVVARRPVQLVKAGAALVADQKPARAVKRAGSVVFHPGDGSAERPFAAEIVPVGPVSRRPVELRALPAPAPAPERVTPPRTVGAPAMKGSQGTTWATPGVDVAGVVSKAGRRPMKLSGSLTSKL